jgi:uncharacterized protein YcfJ
MLDGDVMTTEREAAGKRWKIAGAVIGALIGLVITANDDLFDLMGLAKEMRFPYQLLGLLGGGCIGAALGQLIGRRGRRELPAQRDRDA